MGRPCQVVVVSVVSTIVEAVSDATLLVLRGVVVALVSAGGATGGGASDGPGGCAGSDADGVGAVLAVMWTGAVGVFLGVGVGGATGCRPGCGRSLGCCGR